MSEATQIIAIDGPAGAGKSSVAHAVARRMDMAYLDTGAMYRAATWRALHHHLDLDDGEALAESTRAMQLELHETEHGTQVTVDGQDVSKLIRAPEVTRVVYKLDQNSEVRKHLVVLQRLFGESRPTVAEGRDIGTVVFPKAKCKIFLDASIGARTKRRAHQLAELGVEVDTETLRGEIRERDEQSRSRADSPLRQSEDAVRLDSSDMTFEEVVDQVVRLARERL